MAKTLEESQYTSVKHRIEKLREKAAAFKKRHAGMHVPRDGYLAPLSIDERRDPIGPCVHRHGLRASDKGFLSMPIESYLELLDWTARQIVRDKRDSTPASARPVLERLGLSAPTWCALVKDFGRLFYAVAGQPHSIDEHRSRRGNKRHRYKTRRRTREVLYTA